MAARPEASLTLESEGRGAGSPAWVPSSSPPGPHRPEPPRGRAQTGSTCSAAARRRSPGRGDTCWARGLCNCFPSSMLTGSASPPDTSQPKHVVISSALTSRSPLLKALTGEKRLPHSPTDPPLPALFLPPARLNLHQVLFSCCPQNSPVFPAGGSAGISYLGFCFPEVFGLRFERCF